MLHTALSLPTLVRLLVALSLTQALPACTLESSGAARSPAATADVYTVTEASPGGIGKLYQGREIAHVMGHLGASWLQRPTREAEERTDLLLDNLPLDADTVVADIGAGSGYFSLPIALRVSRYVSPIR